MSTGLFSPGDLALYLLQAAATTQAASLRVLAAVILVVMICALLYVLRNVKSLRAEAGARERTGARQTSYVVIFVACALIFIAACFLLFRMANA